MNISSWSGYAFDVPGGPSADSRYPGAELDLHARWLRSRAAEMVGPPGFEPGSIGPKPTSISQTNPRALMSLHRKGSHEGY